MQTKNDRHNKKGIALILVLGVLSVFVMLAVTLLITARTERLVSKTAQDNTRARHLVKTALADAMDYLDGRLWYEDKKIALPKDYTILFSEGGDAIGPDLHLISGDVTNYLPRRYLWTDTDAKYKAFDKEQLAQWIYVKDADRGNMLIGRYAYLCFDCTGLLDINRIATNPLSGQRRWNGKSIGEIDLSLLPEAKSMSHIDDLRLQANRNLYHRFDTIKEIALLNDGYDEIASSNEHNVIFEPELNNLTPYSLCYDSGWWDWSSDSWQTAIPGVPVDVRGWSETQAEAAFADAGYGASASMAKCLMDYMDTNFVPMDVNIPSCEPIPMINEVMFHDRLELTGQTLKYSHIFEVELWYPFPGNPNPNRYTVTFNTYPPDLLSAAKTMSFTLIPFGGGMVPCVCEPNNFPVDAAGPFTVVTAKFDFVYTFTNVLTSDDYPITVRTRGLRDLLGITEKDQAGVLVDSVGSVFPTVMGFTPLQLKKPSETLAVATEPYAISSVNDPRFNHLSAAWAKTVVTPGTSNAVPNFGLSVSGDPEGTAMYVRNSTNLESVAELGFIPTTNNWTTVDLFSDGGRQLLTKYRVSSLAAVPQYTNGPVNPNTLYGDVLSALFTNAPIEEYPGQNPPPMTLRDRDMIGYITSDMLQISETSMAGQVSFDSSAGWVTIPALNVRGTLTTAGLNNGQKESIIRNTYELFNANQNLFTIVLVGQVLADQGTVGIWEPGIDVVAGEKRALSVVWRDPFPATSTSNCEKGIQFFLWMDD